MTVEIVIPTYQREEKLCRLIKSITANVYPEYKITVLPDHGRKHVFRLINEQSMRSDADIFLGISDDTVFEPTVIEHAAKSMEKCFPDTDGIIYMNWINLPNVCKGAIAFVGKKFRKRFPNGFIYCPDYISLYADSELSNFAESISKLEFCSLTGLYHYHPAHYPEELDRTHELGRENMGNDSRMRRLRNEKGYLWGKDFKMISPFEEVLNG